MGSRRGELLLHPAVVAAAVVLVVNDRVLKHAAPSWWTGKLSDVAGLALLPVLLVSLAELVPVGRSHRAPAGPRTLAAVGAAVAVSFALVKLGPAAGAYRTIGADLRWVAAAPLTWVRTGHAGRRGRVGLVQDVSDLLALPAAFLGVLVARRRPAAATCPAAA